MTPPVGIGPVLMGAALADSIVALLVAVVAAALRRRPAPPAASGVTSDW